MKYKSLGVIGPGNHFQNKIRPVIKLNNFFKIKGFLKKKKINKKNFYSEKDFFKKKFDFVYIACPNELHEKYIIKSLNAGYNVICEKPFLTSSKNLKKIIKLSEKKKKLIFECFMYVYHPVFSYIKKLIEKRKYGPIKYVVSNFKFPSLNKNNNRYFKKLGNGFFFDAAVYPISLENYLFKFRNKPKILQKTFKKVVDLRGYTFLDSNHVRRLYYWGEGQKYSNNLEIFFKNGSLFVDKFFSKAKNEKILLKIKIKDKIYLKKFKKCNQFEKMFEVIKKNYSKKFFLRKNRELINRHYKLLDLIKSS